MLDGWLTYTRAAIALTGESGRLIFTDMPTDCADWLVVAATPVVTGFIAPIV